MQGDNGEAHSAKFSHSRVLFLLLQAVVELLVLREVAQLGDVVKHSLQIVVTDLALERGDQRASLFCRITAERACKDLQSVYILSCFHPPTYSHLSRNPASHSMPLTQLCPLKLSQLSQRLSLARNLLHRLAALEARKSREVGVVLVDQVVVGERQLGVLCARFFDASEQLMSGGGAESGGRGHLAQLEVAGGLFVAGGFGAAARSLREVG